MEKKSFVGEHDEVNCWISFVLYAVTGRMQQADAIMRLYGDKVRAQAKRQRKLMPIPKKPLYRGIVLENDRPISNNEAIFDDGELLVVAKPPDPGPRVIGDDGRVDHALAGMHFVSHTEDRSCAQWFAAPHSAVSAFAYRLHPNLRGYVLSLPEPPSLVLWHHSWTTARTPTVHISLEDCALQHVEIAPYASQFSWNMKTQKEVILEPSSKRLEIEPLEYVDVNFLNEKFCPPQFLEA